MFTGITRGLFEVIQIQKYPGLLEYTIRLSDALSRNLHPGDSVSVDGVCQTLVHLDGTDARFQAIQETLDKTTLNSLCLGNVVSIERSFRHGDEIGGHEVSGHVYGTGLVHQKMPTESQLNLVIQCPSSWMKYILPKGFIALDGSSLTVGQTFPDDGLFQVYLIPETLRLTKFGQKQVGDQVNVEFCHKTKTIVDTVERVLATKSIDQVGIEKIGACN
jgi:riboflavin synthase